jgi:outer membrane receptor protein involved in Fe transport
VGVARDITGEGSTIQIRGLGSSFTKILLNGAPIAVASSGPIDGANTSREVDLDLLPTDLFTKLTVSKSPTAEMIEGGAAGVVNLRSARPFDKEGRTIAASITATSNRSPTRPAAAARSGQPDLRQLGYPGRRGAVAPADPHHRLKPSATPTPTCRPRRTRPPAATTLAAATGPFQPPCRPAPATAWSPVK